MSVLSRTKSIRHRRLLALILLVLTSAGLATVTFINRAVVRGTYVSIAGWIRDFSNKTSPEVEFTILVFIDSPGLSAFPVQISSPRFSLTVDSRLVGTVNGDNYMFTPTSKFLQHQIIRFVISDPATIDAIGNNSSNQLVLVMDAVTVSGWYQEKITRSDSTIALCPRIDYRCAEEP